MILRRYSAADPPAWANDPREEEPIMIEAPSHLIRIPGGGVRVLRTICGAQCYLLSYDVDRGERMCRTCGCTAAYGCAGGCAWISATHDLCSRCFEKELLL